MALALDVDDLVVAMRLARRLRPWFGVAKIGLELYMAAGSDAVAVMLDEGYRVFLDVKLHDIPTTVGRAARIAGGLGVSFLTVHAGGGHAMVRAAVDGLADGTRQATSPPSRPARSAGPDDPSLVPLDAPSRDAPSRDAPRVPSAAMVLGVTVLTSDPGATASDLAQRLDVAVEAGCAGVVCGGDAVAAVKQRWPAVTAVVPGIRLAGSSHDDQIRVATPGAALLAGADLLVIGRTVTGAANPEEAARAVADQVREVLAVR